MLLSEFTYKQKEWNNEKTHSVILLLIGDENMEEVYGEKTTHKLHAKIESWYMIKFLHICLCLKK